MPKTSLGGMLPLIFVFGCGPAPLEPREPTPGVPHFKIATFNLHYPTAGDAATTSAVAGTRADMIFVQEVTSAWYRSLLARFSDTHPYRSFFVDSDARGLGLLSRFPLLQASRLLPPNGWHPAQRVVIDTPAGALQVLHVHLRSKFEGTGDPISNLLSSASDHVKELRGFFEDCAELPTIVLGDFNEEPDGSSLEWLDRRGFRNVLPLYHPGQGTWSAPSVAGQASLTIDHILFDSYTESLDAYVTSSGNSDHSPVVAHFEAARPFEPFAADPEAPAPSAQN